MADGVMRVNQHVVDAPPWALRNARPGRLSLSDDLPFAPLSVRRMVEGEVVPRLAGHRAVSSPRLPTATRDDVLDLVDRLLGGSEGSVEDQVSALLRRGVAVESVFLDLFQPAARHIGELWCADHCDFLGVTLALGTMQRLMRRLAPLFLCGECRGEGSREILLMPLDGEQHTFGLAMVAEFFRRGGWDVHEAVLGGREAAAALRTMHFAIVGITIGSETRLGDLRRAIRDVRRRSCNRAVKVLVGGPLLAACPDLAERVGADDAAPDARQAMALAEDVVRAAALPSGRRMAAAF